MRLTGSVKRCAFAAVTLLSATICTPVGAGTGARPADALSPTGRWTAYQRGAAQRPPMGWNSWNAFGSNIDEAKLISAATTVVDTGLAKKGYRYIDLDDGWWLKRRLSDGRIIVRTNASCPGTSTTPIVPIPSSNSGAKPRSMVMPLRFSSGRRSVSTPVRARTSAVFP